MSMNATTPDRGPLLPKSGVGVVGPWLVIAPEGNPVIRLDLRLIDRVELRRDGDENDDEQRVPSVPDVSTEDPRCEVILACGDLEVTLYIEDGAQAAESIVKACAQHTRSATKGAAGGTEVSQLAAVVAERKDPPNNAKLLVLSSTPDGKAHPGDPFAGHTFEMSKAQVFVGREDDNDVVLDHRSISSTHAKVVRDQQTGCYAIMDLGATNGVRVNGEQCNSAELSHGDFVDLGHVRLQFLAPGQFPPWRSAPTPRRDEFLFVGRDAVALDGERLRIGALLYRIDEVREYALRGANIPLSGGRLLQAAMALLVVALNEVETSGESSGH